MHLDRTRTALLIVDAQRGFTDHCPEELPVPGGRDIVPHLNRLLALPWARIDATQDWHPPDHCSFHGRRDALYPPHCVRGTPGAEFLPGLETWRFQTIWRKGFESHRDAYAVTAQHSALPAFYRTLGVSTVVLAGLATNICVYLTARDLRYAGFRVLIVEDASAGIDVPAAGLFQERARKEGLTLGIEYVKTADVVASLATEPASDAAS